MGADAHFKDVVETKPGLTKFWPEFEASFDEPFRSHVTAVFAPSRVTAEPAHGAGGTA